MFKKIALTCLTTLILIWSPSTSEAAFGGHVGAHLGVGNFGGAGQPVGSKSLGTLDLQAMPGYRIFGNSLMLGVLFNLRYLSDLNGASGYDKDASGTGSLIGLALAYEFSVFKIIGSWDLRARQSGSNPDTTYKGSGYTILFGYKTMPNFYVDFMVNKTSYTSREVLDIPETFVKPVQHWNLALGMSYSF
jgi:hypothetical protein